MENQIKIVGTFNHQFDPSYINFEIKMAPQYQNINQKEMVQLMVDPQIKELCRQHLVDTLVNQVGIIYDYWFNGYEWKKEFGIEEKEVFELVYGENPDPQKFLDMVKKDLDEIINFQFDNENILNEEVNWGISFI